MILWAVLFHTLVSFIVWLIFHLLVFGLPPFTTLLFPLVLLPLVIIEEQKAGFAHHLLFQRQKSAVARQPAHQRRLAGHMFSKATVGGEVDIQSRQPVETEHDVCRVSAGTSPGAPLAGTSVTRPMHTTDQSSSAAVLTSMIRA